MGRTRSDIQPRIVEAARARFLQEGVDGASLRAIAADAGTSIGMVYYYFPTKDEVFFAVVEDIYAGLLEDLTAALAPDVDVRERLRRLYHRIGAMSEREAITVRLILREVLASNDRLGRLLDRFMRGHIPLVLATIRDGISDGTLVGDVPPIVLVLVTFAVGAAPQFVLGHAGAHLPFAGIPSGPALGDLLVRLLVDGSGRREPARRPKPRPIAKPRPAKRAVTRSGASLRSRRAR